MTDIDASDPWWRIDGAGRSPWSVSPSLDRVLAIGRDSASEVAVMTTVDHRENWEPYAPLDSAVSLHRNLARLSLLSAREFGAEVLQFIYFFGFLFEALPPAGYSERLSMWRREVDDIFEAVVGYENQEVNHLRITDKLLEHCGASFTPDYGLAVAPKNLVGVMWIELAGAYEELLGGRSPAFLDCEICARVFSRSRKDQRFCSHNCKMKDYRERRKTTT